MLLAIGQQLEWKASKLIQLECYWYEKLVGANFSTLSVFSVQPLSNDAQPNTHYQLLAQAFFGYDPSLWIKSICGELSNDAQPLSQLLLQARIITIVIITLDLPFSFLPAVFRKIQKSFLLSIFLCELFLIRNGCLSIGWNIGIATLGCWVRAGIFSLARLPGDVSPPTGMSWNAAAPSFHLP